MRFHSIVVTGSLLLSSFAAHATVNGGAEFMPAANAPDFQPVQFGGGFDPRAVCQDAAGRYWQMPQDRIGVSEPSPTGPGLFQMNVWAPDGRQAICVADITGRVRSFNETGGGYGPGPGPGYPPPPGGPGYGPGPGPGYGGGADPSFACQQAGARYWRTSPNYVTVSNVRPNGDGTFRVRLHYADRRASCTVDQGGRVLNFEER